MSWLSFTRESIHWADKLSLESPQGGQEDRSSAVSVAAVAETVVEAAAVVVGLVEEVWYVHNSKK